MSSSDKMNAHELRGSLSLALIFFLRMFGLFLILPVFVLYAETLPDATPLLTGIALGAYGLTQALFQIPFGLLSDRLGRKPVIAAGLIIFAIGSVIAALADSMVVIIIGRALQGTGAIAATILALAADLSRDNQRSKAMAVIGISVGIAFSLAFVAGPLLSTAIGVPGLFLLAGGLTLPAIAVLYTLVPNPAVATRGRHYPGTGMLSQVVKNRQLLICNFGIFSLHMVLMSSFVAIPLMLRDQGALAAGDHWQVYLPVLVVSGLIMFPLLILSERLARVRTFLLAAILLLSLAEFLFSLAVTDIVLQGVFLLLFFTAFNFLEATLPSQASQSVDPALKGTALGTFSTSQFIGIFIGGLAGGHLYAQGGGPAVFLFGAVAALVWLAVNLLTNTTQSA